MQTEAADLNSDFYPLDCVRTPRPHCLPCWASRLSPAILRLVIKRIRAEEGYLITRTVYVTLMCLVMI